MIISLSGAGGAGKSTMAKKLANVLGWPHYYMGGLRREAAAKKGITLAEYNKLGEMNPLTDQEVDLFQQELGEKKDNFIIEGRTSWHFIPHSLKIYLEVSKEEGAKRIFKHLQQENNRNEDVELSSVLAVKNSMTRRLESDNLRYKKYYGIDVNNPANYDLYLDTSDLNENESFNIVYNFIKDRLDKTNI
ncbi:MAG: hypothetical protein EOM88_03505 [Clostridia bacterium]|jgi:predicted cytidylate kinase|nr:hypothetical protein [Clostridia bacterium]